MHCVRDSDAVHFPPLPRSRPHHLITCPITLLSLAPCLANFLLCRRVCFSCLQSGHASFMLPAGPVQERETPQRSSRDGADRKVNNHPLPGGRHRLWGWADCCDRLADVCHVVTCMRLRRRKKYCGDVAAAAAARLFHLGTNHACGGR